MVKVIRGPIVLSCTYLRCNPHGRTRQRHWGKNGPHRVSWGCHKMETFSALLTLYVGNLPVTSSFPSQRPVTRSFDDLFDLHLKKWLSIHSWGQWFETPLRFLWRHSNVKRINENLKRKLTRGINIKHVENSTAPSIIENKEYVWSAYPKLHHAWIYKIKWT